MTMRVSILLLAYEHCRRINWELFDHPAYSLDFTPRNYNLLTYLNWFRSQRFNINEELMESVKTCMRSKLEDSFDIGIPKLIPRYKCLGDYADK
jgi:hypothetical protein